MSKIKQITIGVAGHIDHGKTSLVKKLTGINTDNLNEEIKRGMTINIGFAHLNDNICLIDVPGHENFIKNMIAGVCSIDFAILVIAADDGIMPQTIEHFEILSLLGVSSGCIVINKIDLVDKEWLDLVENDIKAKFKNTFLDIDNIFMTSTINNEGIELLKNFINNINVKDKYNRDVFRMFIDRVFTKTGFGNVVTGTVTSGNIKIGEKLKILPHNKIVKIRGLQSHDNNVDLVKIGDRGAINLHSLEKIKIKRGDHLSTCNSVNLTDNAIVKAEILSKHTKKIKSNQRVRFLLGTQEVMARIFIFNDCSDSEKMFFLVKFENSIVACFKDKFIIRSYSPVSTIGGGTIIDINISGKWKDNKKYVSLLSNENNNDVDLVTIIIEANKKNPYDLESISVKLGLSTNIVRDMIKDKNLSFYGIKDNPWIITPNQKKYIFNDILNFIEDYHEKNKYAKGVTKEQINIIFNYNINLLNELLLSLVKENKLRVEKEMYFLDSFEIKLNNQDKKIQKQIVDLLGKQKFNTTSIKDLCLNYDCNSKKIFKLITIDDQIIVINSTYIITRENYQKLLIMLEQYFKNNTTLTVKDFKDLTDTSRKYAVPLLEHLDKEKITYRLGNERKIFK